MLPIRSIDRRRFLGTSLLGLAALGTVRLSQSSAGAVTRSPGDPFRGLKVGIASYSLRKFNLEQALAMTQQAGLKYISLKDIHLPLKSTSAQREAVRQQVRDAGITLLGGGVIYMNNREDEIQSAFQYAHEAGMPTVVCSPDPAAMDLVERVARQHQIRVAIHNHGPGDKRYPSALDVLRMVKDRDPLMGICLDVGHTVRLGEDPVAVIRDCAPRLYDFHIKDVTAATAQGAAAEIGKGVVDIVGVLRALLGMKYGYHLALEYEANAEAPMPGIIESLAYVRGVLAGLAEG